MKIFITGTTGFIGHSLKDFYSREHVVSEYTRGTNITDALDAANPDIIINCAGEIYNPNLMYKTNVGLVEQILEWLRLHSDVRMINIGSSSEYGPLDHPGCEKDRINPQNIYEATKGAATLLCQGYAREYNLQTCVARIYSGYGAYERERRLFPTLYRAFFKDEPMTLYNGVHDFIYIDDFIRGIDLLLQSEWPTGEIVNFGSGDPKTNKQVLDAWEAVTGRTAPIAFKDTFMRAHDTDVWCCDTSYADNRYGFKTTFTLEQGIADFIRKKK